MTFFVLFSLFFVIMIILEKFEVMDMIREYYHFIKEYLQLAEIKPLYLVINFVSTLLYKVFAVLMPFVASLLIRYLTLQDANITYLCLGAFILVYLLYILSLYVNYKIYGYNISYCYDRLTKRVLDKLMHVDTNFTKMISKGRLMNSINGDIIDIGDMNDEIAEFFMGIIQIVLVLVILGMNNVYLTIVLILYAIVFVTVRNRADRKMNMYHGRVKVQDDKYSTLLTQIVSGLQEIKTFNMLPKLKKKLNVIQNRFIKQYSLKRKYITIRDNDVEVVTYAFRFLLYALLVVLMILGRVDVSILVLAVSYHESLMYYIDDLIDSTSTIREVNTSVNRINDILNYRSTNIVFGDNEENDIYGNIDFRHVNLEINGNTILKNITFTVNHNEVVAIVGEAGSGKTSIINLLLRLVKPSSGDIRIDNINIYDFTKEIYSKNVAVVNQKPFIFNMSIRKNLNFVDKNIAHQIEACKKAGIHDFIETLPNGYSTILRENGSNISGGQKQMISIARTILSEAEIILLDDITTSLDPDTAKFVPKLIQNLKKERTILLVTKKPELMRIADKIIVLEAGHINAIGTHKELIKHNEIYQELQARKSPSKMGVFQND